MKNDFLLEILTEELPPKNLLKLSGALTQEIINGLQAANLNYKEVLSFATPRRLAVLVKQLDHEQPQQKIERRGPALAAAFDDKGKPTKACLGFAKSCDADVDALEKMATEKGTWLVLRKTQKGENIFALLPNIVKQAIKKLPVAKQMRWGNHTIEFVRPVHSIIMLYGNKIIPAEILGLPTGNKTKGHRFHCKKDLIIKTASDYPALLQKEGYVVADFAKRKNIIQQQITKFTKKINATALIDAGLLDEVTALVEWPVALVASFPPEFLKVPKEALISSMQDHQKCFPLVDTKGNLLPQFITVSNIESKNPAEIIKGNECVMNARLADAKFFYEQDLQTPLKDFIERTKKVTYEKQLGSLYDKTERVKNRIYDIALAFGTDTNFAARAAELAKADLMSSMVYELPELQGIMGEYYTASRGESKEVAVALREQYMPLNAEAELPKTKTGIVLAVASRLDTLYGMFLINKIPTGDKDPYGLRRAALAIIRIAYENRLTTPLVDLIPEEALYKLKNIKQKNENARLDLCGFIYERLKYWVISLGFTANQFRAIFEPSKIMPPPIHVFIDRLNALKAFMKLPEAENLIIANKRIKNILGKQKEDFTQCEIDQKLLTESAEIKLAALVLEAEEKRDTPSHIQPTYQKTLHNLAKLRQPIDDFFDKVMVMVDDKKIRNNRLTLLAKLRNIFLGVADISLL
jgi:glycyl-tRNA synthetase beta chain